MNLTKKLFRIVLFLIFLIITYVVIVKRDDINKYILTKISEYEQNKIIIPGENYNKRNYNFKAFSETNDFTPSSIENIQKIYYTVLNNGWKNFTFYCDYDDDNCLNMVKSVSNSNYVKLINNYVSPYNSYYKYNTLFSGNQITLQVESLYTKDEINKLNEYVDNYLNENNINSNNVTLDDIKKIHDFIIKNVTYDENYTEGQETASNKANTALFDGIALCSGYTDAFAIFLDKLNIPNFKVSNSDHVWNVIYFDNKWTHIDVTWDDDEVNENNIYNFFMVDTDKLLELDQEKHTFEINDYLELN